MTELSYDALLEYLSALHYGSWGHFRSAVQTVERSRLGDDAPRAPSTVAANLTTLGHAEFAFDTTLEWAMTPPCIVGTPALGEGMGVLTGSRTSKILNDVNGIAAKLGLHCAIIPQERAPSVVKFDAQTTDGLATIAERANAGFEPLAASRLLRCLPSLAAIYRAAPEDYLPSGFDVQRWDALNCRWQPIDDPLGDGAFFFDSYRPEYRLVHKGTIKKMARGPAIYLASAQAGEHFLEYVSTDDDLGELIVPIQATLPTLHARALVLCSGRLPVFDANNRSTRYPSIPASFAARISRKLGHFEEGH